jgi:hypothetical protein
MPSNEVLYHAFAENESGPAKLGAYRHQAGMRPPSGVLDFKIMMAIRYMYARSPYIIPEFIASAAANYSGGKSGGRGKKRVYGATGQDAFCFPFTFSREGDDLWQRPG